MKTALNIKHSRQCLNSLTTSPSTSKSSKFVNSLLEVWKCDQPRSFVFDILNKGWILVFIPIVPTRPNQIHFHRSITADFFHFQKRRLFHRVKTRRRHKEDQGGWEWSKPPAEHEVCSVATTCAETKPSGRLRIETNHGRQLEIKTLWWLTPTPTWQISNTKTSS